MLEGIDDKVVDPAKFGNVKTKAKMTLRSKVDGYVISRDAVPGDYYERNDTLMEISPLDHLWVFAEVNRAEHEKVRVDQAMEVQIPFLSQTVRTHVEGVTSSVSKGTRIMKIRGTIPNPGMHLKPDMLVRIILDLVP